MITLKETISFIIIFTAIILIAGWLSNNFRSRFISSYETPPDAYIEYPESSIF